MEIEACKKGSLDHSQYVERKHGLLNGKTTDVGVYVKLHKHDRVTC